LPIDPATAGLLLVAAPGAGYVIAYFHELGWARQFRIPAGLIATQLADVLAATAALFAIALLLPVFVLVYRLVRPSVPILPTESLIVGIVGPLVVLMWLLSVGDPEQGAGSAVATALLILVLFATIIFRSGIFRRRLEEDAGTAPYAPLMRALMDRGRTFWVVLCIAVGVIFAFAYALGGEQARNQPTFPVSDTPAPEVELAIYGDTVVLAPFDRSTHMVRPEFDIVKIGPTPLHLRFENVGPLKTDKKLTLGA
jgi:hypothetical protein